MIWTPVEIPEVEEEERFVPPTDFNEKAVERRKDAVDEIFSKLVFD